METHPDGLDLARSLINKMITELERQDVDSLSIATAMGEYTLNYVETFLPSEDQKTVYRLFIKQATDALEQS